MKINTFLSIIVIILIILSVIFLITDNSNFFTSNREIIQKQIDTLEFCGIIEKTEFRPEGKGYPFFRINSKWYHVGVGGGINYFTGDSVYKKAGSNLIKIYHKRDNWSEEIVEL